MKGTALSFRLLITVIITAILLCFCPVSVFANEATPIAEESGLQMYDYVTLKGNKAWLVLYRAERLYTDEYTYGGESMYWSDNYNAYCYLELASSRPAFKTVAKVSGSRTKEIEYTLDINGSGTVDANDAQLVYNIYNAVNDAEGGYADLSDKVTVEKYLLADVNSDCEITVDDAIAIINGTFIEILKNRGPVVSWMTSGSYKNVQSYEGPAEKNHEYDLNMAKNESEGVQIAFRANKNVNNVSFSIEGNLPKGITAEFFEVRSVKIENESWPDGLVPLENRTLDLKKGVTTAVLVKFTTESDTPAQNTIVTVVMKDGENNLLGEYEINLTVWDITIPETPSIATYMPIYKSSLAKQYYGVEASALDETQKAEIDVLYKEYYDFLLSYGISGGELPYDVLDESNWESGAIQQYLNDCRVTSFIFETGKLGESYDSTAVKTVYDNWLSANTEWLNKAVYYVIDEPTTGDELRELKSRVDTFKNIAPNVRIASAYYSNGAKNIWIDLTKYTDTTEVIQTFVNTPVPKLSLLNDASLRSRYESFDGEFWTYVCWSPGKPYTNLFVNEQGIDHRILMLQTYDVGASGFLYWSANYWNLVDDPWTNMATFSTKVDGVLQTVYGDGSVLYPGNKAGIDGFDDPCPSLRLEAIRDGIEDIALLKMAELAIGKDAVDALIDRLTTELTEYVEKDAHFTAFRNALLSAVASAQN